MDQAEQDRIIADLGQRMSEVSERCWHAGWLVGTEFLLPELCRRARMQGRAQPWGQDAIQLDEAAELIALADRLGSWVTLADDVDGYIAFNPFPTPERYRRQLDDR